MKRHKTIYLDKMQKVDFCGSQFMTFEAGTFELPFSIHPTKGDHNYESCENCRKQKQQYIKDLKKRASLFPFCCDEHSRLKDFGQYNKNNYKGLEEEIADKIMYTHHHIINHLDEDEWYEKITEYLEYVFESFGSFPQGYGSGFLLTDYVFSVKELTLNIRGCLTSEKNITPAELDIRLNKIASYIDIRFTPKSEKKNKNIDVNIVLTTYDKWFKTFPFDLSYFKHLKEHYRKTIPILTGEIVTNRYSGQTLAVATTKENLTRLLIQTTKNIITNINGLKLHEKQELTDAENIELELIFKNRELQLSEMASLDNTDRKEYIKILKRWFKEEKSFISSIKPYLRESVETKKVTSTDITRSHIAYCIHYLSATKSLVTDNPFPSDKAWKELGARYNKNAKNIQKVYNEINSNPEIRMGKTKITVIKFVTDEMLQDHPKALKLAKDELKLAQMKS